MRTRALLDRLKHEDSGLGIVTAIFVMAMVGALALTAVALTVNNLENSRRDRQSLAALATSEAGVSQAVARLRTGSLGSLTCMEAALNAGSCIGASESWTSAVNPKQVRLDGTPGACTSSTDCFRVWISTISPYVPNCPGRTASPPRPCKGTYRIHATGVSGNGPGARQLAVDVDVAPYPFPIGVFAENFAGSGQLGIHRQSLFTTGCVQNRVRDDTGGSGVRFEYDSANGRPKLDLIYNIPSAAHAQGEISTSNNSCGSGSGGAPIHNTTTKCNANFRFDQSGSGAALSSADSPCWQAYGSYPETSRGNDLQQRYGYRPRGLTEPQYAALLSQATAEGTYNLDPSQIAARLSALAAAGTTSPVLYWDNGSVSLKQSDFPADFSRALSSSPDCGSKSVTIVVTGAGNNLAYQGGNNAPYLVASIFVPDGQLTGTGARNTIGTIFAKSIDMSGGNEFYMDECFANNPPGATVDVKVVNWAEDDAADFN